MTPAELAAAYDADVLLEAYMLAAKQQRWRWVTYHPEQGIEYHDTRAEAEAFAIEIMTEHLHDRGEAYDSQAEVCLCMGSTEEIVGACREDDPVNWPHEYDYAVEGYRVVRP